jgi:hypothetical protein
MIDEIDFKLARYDKLQQKSLEADRLESARIALLKKEVTVLIDGLKGGCDGLVNMITYAQLSVREFGVWFDLENGVRFKRVRHRYKKVYYVTEMNPMEHPKKRPTFGKQVHDCKEIGKVIKGELIETYECNKRYEKNDVFVYPAGFIHKPWSGLYSLYGVEFLDPKKQ